VSDPYNWHTYSNQLNRWYEGFFQNIKVRNWNLFGNLAHAITVYGYMVMNIFGAPMLLIGFYLLVEEAPMTILTGVFMAFFTLWIYPAFKEFMAGHSLVLYTYNFFTMFAISFVNYYLYLRALIRILVLNKKEQQWIKGH
jgi:hypothetical protein